MPNSGIYLFKTARRPVYRKENLNILAEQRGSIVEVAYNRGWVAADYFDSDAIPRGTPVTFVLTERPYEDFVPIRSGEVVTAEWDEIMLRLRIVLGSWVSVQGTDLKTFTQVVKQTGSDVVPGRKFVSPKRDRLELVPYYDEREDEGWRRVVEEVIAMSGRSTDDLYRESVFFRSVGIRMSDGEFHRARRTRLNPGTEASLRLDFHNPHLTEEQVGQFVLRADGAADEIVVNVPERFPIRGSIDVDVQILNGDPLLSLQIGPATAQHTHVTERFRTNDEEIDEGAGIDKVQRTAELLGIYDFIRRNASLEPGDLEDFFERFSALLPHEARISEDWAFWLDEIGRGDLSFGRLRQIDPEQLSDRGKFALFRLGLRWNPDEEPHLTIARLSLTSERLFERLLDVLEQVGPPQLRFLPELALELPADQLRLLIDRLGARLESPDVIRALAEAIFLVSDDPGWACSYLRQRITELHLADRALEEALLEFAGKLPPGTVMEIEEIGTRRIVNHIEAGRLEDATRDLRSVAATLTWRDRDRLLHAVCDRLATRRRIVEAQELLVEHAWSACAAGEISAAVHAITRAVGVQGASGDSPEWLQEAASKVIDLATTYEPLIAWKKDEEERRRDVLRSHLLNQKLLIAGGLKRPNTVERVSKMTGATVHWAESYHDESGDLKAYASKVKNGSYALVVYLYQKTGHDTGTIFREACKSASVPFVYSVGAGADGLVEGIWRAYCDREQ